MSNEKTFIFDSSEGQKDNKNNNNVVKILGASGAVLLVAGGVTYAMSGDAKGAGQNIALTPTEVKSEVVEEDASDTATDKTAGKGFFEIHSEEETVKTVGGTTVSKIETTNVTGTTFNPFTAPHAHSVNDNMSFAQAFAAARQETGAGGVFAWRGQVYGTFYATEVDKNMNPIIPYGKTEYNPITWQGTQHGHGASYLQQYGGTMGKSDYFEREDGWLNPINPSRESAVEGGGLLGKVEEEPKLPDLPKDNDQAGDVHFLQGHGGGAHTEVAQVTPEMHDTDTDMSDMHGMDMGGHGGLLDQMDNFS